MFAWNHAKNSAIHAVITVITQYKITILAHFCRTKKHCRDLQQSCQHLWKRSCQEISFHPQFEIPANPYQLPLKVELK